ncbi:MAG: RNA-binding transcriptional accessory protein [Chloroflexi bacterium]|nr:RNA-binding transcriptional accessory protein [Chloroflexota bacterium]
MKDLIGKLADQLGLRRQQVERTVQLFDDENTLPFIARYRKEFTGGMDEETLSRFQDRLADLRRLAERQEQVLNTIREQGVLTPELEEQIEEAETLQVVEDLYLPYKPRRRTRAQKAREAGLEPLAEAIADQVYLDGTRESVGEMFLNADVPTVEAAWQGARDIVAEWVAEDARCREIARSTTWAYGTLQSEVVDAAADEKGVYETYYQFSRTLDALRPYQILAINRGESEGILRVHLATFPDDIIADILELHPPDYNSQLSTDLHMAVEDSFKRLIRPAIEREVRRDLKEWADEHAIEVFAYNLRGLLLQRPLKGRVVMGIDPGYRSGCKVAVVDTTGRVLATMTVYPHPPQERWDEAIEDLRELIVMHGVSLIAVGNGTASRETEDLAAELIRIVRGDLRYLIVSEAGASVYSASKLAREELPKMDVSLRGAVSIARRAQDPLAELVKIDPKSIGVGLYQHDVDQKALERAVQRVTESVVNQVGVDLNTASPALLQYVAGLGPTLAERIVEFREQYGQFLNREELMRVKGLGEKTYEQAVGFLRIFDGTSALDRTGIHPESYKAALRLLRVIEASPRDSDLPEKIERIRANVALDRLAEKFKIGEPTMAYILDELINPGRDPREDVPPPVLRADVLRMEDLQPGMLLKGTVRNVVDFGAFVDIGVKEDGLVHISNMAIGRVESPYEVVQVGDVIEVTVVDVDSARGRIGLSMIGMPVGSEER